MNRSINFFNKKIKNTDIHYRDFNFSFCLKVLTILLIAGIFFDNPANSIHFSIYPLEEATRLNLRPAIILFGGILLGPLWGAVLGGLVDVLAFFIWHSDLNYIVYFTLLTMLRGFLAGYIYNYVFSEFNWKSIVCSIALPHFLISGVLIPLLLNLYYGVPILSNIKIRVFIQIFTIPLYSVIFYYIFNGMRKSAELRKLHDRLQKMLRTDELTGLSNRRHFMEFLDKMISLSKRHSHDLSLLMADIDNFKKINDNYGHQKGDLFLKKVGKILKENTRNEDLVARIGGDEFFILLPATGTQKAIKIAKRIKASILEVDMLPNEKNTVSIGVAELKPNDSTESFLKRADDALYIAKENGRNRVESLN